MESDTIQELFSGIKDLLHSRQQRVRDDVKSFFTELTPRIETVQMWEREIELVSASRFNAFKYLRTDENGFSRIIADLLDPRGDHGQGKQFLKIFLKLLQKEQNCSVDSDWFDIDSEENVMVDTEKSISVDGKNRRLDIYVEIKARKNRYCIAFENKHYAQDQECQVADYLAYLESKNYKDFLLIYLSPQGQPPSEYSFPISKYRQWGRKFKIMAYCQQQKTGYEKFKPEESRADKNQGEASGSDGPGPDKFESEGSELDEYGSDGIPDSFKISYSLIYWFEKCRKYCQPKRLRVFLRDAGIYVFEQFGENIMVNRTEILTVKEVKELAFSDDGKYVEAAEIISRSWPKIKDDVYKEFLDLLKQRLESILSRYEVVIKVINAKKELRLSVRGWRNHTYIYMCDSGNQIGVRMDAGLAEEEFDVLCGQISDAIEDNENWTASRRIRRSKEYPWWERDWEKYDSKILDLKKEIDDREGENLEYYATGITMVADTLIPVINAFESKQI